MVPLGTLQRHAWIPSIWPAGSEIRILACDRQELATAKQRQSNRWHAAGGLPPLPRDSRLSRLVARDTDGLDMQVRNCHCAGRPFQTSWGSISQFSDQARHSAHPLSMLIQLHHHTAPANVLAGCCSASSMSLHPASRRCQPCGWARRNLGCPVEYDEMAGRTQCLRAGTHSCPYRGAREGAAFG